MKQMLTFVCAARKSTIIINPVNCTMIADCVTLTSRTAQKENLTVA